MQVTFYCHLYMNEKSEKERSKKLKRSCQPITSSPPFTLLLFLRVLRINWIFFSSLLLKQHIYENTPLFVVGLADGYDSALELIRQITEEVFAATQSVDIRHYILQKHNESIKENRRCQ